LQKLFIFFYFVFSFRFLIFFSFCLFPFSFFFSTERQVLELLSSFYLSFLLMSLSFSFRIRTCYLSSILLFFFFFSKRLNAKERKRKAYGGEFPRIPFLFFCFSFAPCCWTCVWEMECYFSAKRRCRREAPRESFLCEFSSILLLLSWFCFLHEGKQRGLLDV
jgi:hypothetical protein